MSFYEPEITLISKAAGSITPVAVRSDSSMGNLNKYRMSAEYRDTINEVTKNGQITLRSPFGLFDSAGPILTDEATKDLYLIQVQLQQGSDAGQLFRFEISSVNNNDSIKGKHITLNLTSYDIRIEEFYDSENLQLVTPKAAFTKRIENFKAGRTTSANTVNLDYDAATQNSLPDDERLKQDWLPTEPITTKELLSEIIRRVSSPIEIGSTNEDWYYNITPETDTENFRIFVDKMGAVSSGVTLDVQTDGTKVMVSDITANFDNKKYKNGLIIKGKKASHTFPMDFTRYASDMAHAKIASAWSANFGTYRIGDYVKNVSGSNTFYYKCKRENFANAGNGPLTSTANWENLSTSKESSPWTKGTKDLWEANMIGHDSAGLSNYVGFFHDFNIVRVQYDRDDAFDEFESVSVKDVENWQSAPPAAGSPLLQHGRRWLVKTPGSTAWPSSNVNKIAQYDASGASPVWRFSNSPTGSVTGTGADRKLVEPDIVNVLANATIMGFNGSTWEIIWSLDHDDVGESSPFCPIHAIEKIDDRHGVSNKAIEFTFDWNVFELQTITQDFFNLLEYIPFFAGLRLLNIDLYEFVAQTLEAFWGLFGFTSNSALATQLEDVFGIGDKKNRASRRYGFTLKFPFPRVADPLTQAIGSKIKNHTVDFFNLNESMETGNRGWNEGINTEDLGTIRAVRFWVKLKHQTYHTNNPQEVNGIANTPMIFWFRDLSDRIAIHRFTIPIHNSWQKITIPAGPESRLELFDSRIDELFKIWGYTFSFNHFIKERELTGVKFDWSKVVEMGCVNEDSYDENLLYNAGQDAYLSIITEHALQLVNNLAVFTVGVVDVAEVVTDKVKFAIDDLHFVKDAYVTTADSKLAAPRLKKINASNQSDYINLKENIGKRKLSRLQYHPEAHTIYSRGAVKLKAGQRFTLRGQYNTTAKTLVATHVDHIEDSTGYHCRIQAIRKYEP